MPSSSSLKRAGTRTLDSRRGQSGPYSARRIEGQIVYREIQVKFGKLYPVGPAWEREHFDFTSWRFFQVGEHCGHLGQKGLFLSHLLSPDPATATPAYQCDIFIFPPRAIVGTIIPVIRTES